jgi:cell division protease FtsH
MAGPERRSRLITPEEKRIIAYHEAGHGIVSHLLPHAHPVHKITIVARGRALGYTLSLPTEDRYLITKSELLDRLAMTLGGRAAEEIVFGEVTTGAQDDIDQVTKIARQMVCEWGMSPLGPMALGAHHDQVFLGRDFAATPDHSDRVAAEIDSAIHTLIDDAFGRAKTLLRENRTLLDRTAERLVEKETIEQKELEELFAGVPSTKAQRGRILEEAAKPQEARPAKRTRVKQPKPQPKPGLSPA